MSKKTRWILFYTAIVVFLAASYLMVVFALGYKYDFQAGAFVRMGSFRVVTNTDADVYINNKRAGDTSFLGNSFSKGRLLPRTYEVRLERPGYFVWEKNVQIVAGRFVDFPKIVLVPLKYEKEVVATESFGFPMDDSKVRVTKGRELEFDQHTVSIQWTDHTDYQPFHRAGDVQIPFRVSGVIDDVQWYRDQDHVFVATNGRLMFYEIDIRGGQNAYEITKLNSPFYYDSDENAVYLIEGEDLVRLKM